MFVLYSWHLVGVTSNDLWKGNGINNKQELNSKV